MEIIVDTHIFLWSFEESSPLSSSQLQTLKHPENSIFISQFSFMEIAIKMALGKLPFVKLSLDELIKAAIVKNYHILPTLNKYTTAYLQIPLFENHRDPFDRFIIATAKCESMCIMTNDSKFAQYQDIVQIWE